MNRRGNRTEITHDFFLPSLDDKVSKSGGQVRPCKGEYESSSYIIVILMIVIGPRWIRDGEIDNGPTETICLFCRWKGPEIGAQPK